MNSWFVEISSKLCISQTVRPRKLKFWDNVHYPCVSRVTCHVSHITCDISRVTCHVSHVTCHVSHIEEKKFRKKNGKFGGTSWWRVCYQQGLPRLVSSEHYNNYSKHHSICVKHQQISGVIYCSMEIIDRDWSGPNLHFSVSHVYCMYIAAIFNCSSIKQDFSSSECNCSSSECHCSSSEFSLVLLSFGGCYVDLVNLKFQWICMMLLSSSIALCFQTSKKSHWRCCLNLSHTQDMVMITPPISLENFWRRIFLFWQTKAF